MTWFDSSAHQALQSLKTLADRNLALESFLGQIGGFTPAAVAQLRMTEREIAGWRAALATERARLRHRVSIAPRNQLLRLLAAVGLLLPLYWPYRVGSLEGAAAVAMLSVAVQLGLWLAHRRFGTRAQDAEHLAEMLAPAEATLIAEAKAVAQKQEPQSPERLMLEHIGAQGRHPTVLEIAALRAMERSRLMAMCF